MNDLRAKIWKLSANVIKSQISGFPDPSIPGFLQVCPDVSGSRSKTLDLQMKSNYWLFDIGTCNLVTVEVGVVAGVDEVVSQRLVQVLILLQLKNKDMGFQTPTSKVKLGILLSRKYLFFKMRRMRWNVLIFSLFLFISLLPSLVRWHCCPLREGTRGTPPHSTLPCPIAG